MGGDAPHSQRRAQVYRLEAASIASADTDDGPPGKHLPQSMTELSKAAIFRCLEDASRASQAGSTHSLRHVFHKHCIGIVLGFRSTV
jgi:hypothetical protein